MRVRKVTSNDVKIHDTKVFFMCAKLEFLRFFYSINSKFVIMSNLSGNIDIITR